MIPNAKLREVESQGVAESSEFGISMKDTAHIMNILRDTLYSDKVLAVLREYSANAWDAHREVGKYDVPIKVVLPTTMDPTLVIQDFGPGLSHENIFQVYTQYGASTKRDSDNAVGMLGIGSKSAFAYADSFTIISKHGGKQRTYVAVLDESEKGVINLLDEADLRPGEETGITIKIAVEPKDIWEFTTKARKLFEYFHPRPDVNTDLPELPAAKSALKNGTLFDDRTRGWTAIMGCVPYRINVNQIVGVMTDKGEGVGEYITGISGILYFNIGEVQVNASREELKYSTNTKHAIIRRFNLLVEEYVTQTIDAINSNSLSAYEKRLRAQVLRGMGLPVPDDFKDFTLDYVKFKKEPKKFQVTRNGGIVGGLTVSDSTRLLLRDDTRSIKGFNLADKDYVVHKLDDKYTIDEVRDELTDILKQSNLDGIPTVLTSTLSWYVAPKEENEKKVNKKHKVTTFVLDPEGSFYFPWSEHWDIEEREPTADDVFVVLEGFKTHGVMGYDIYTMYKEDETLAKQFGVKLPKVYGYKSTKKKPVLASTCLGTDYRTWRTKFIKDLLTPKNRRLIEYHEWSQLALYGYYDSRKPSKTHLDWIKEELGASHHIYKLFKKQQIGARIFKKRNYERDKAIESLKERALDSEFKSERTLAMEEIRRMYPMFEATNNTLSVLCNDHRSDWVKYIQLVDNSKENP